MLTRGGQGPHTYKVETDMLVIGIAGGTGSGKSTVVRKIIESLPQDEVAVMPQDSYYKDNRHIPLEERLQDELR